ncbi:hypothetical protein ACJIZ3_009707 [Penstemon smallii]|uniref:Glycosyltransferase n=1 Tax=Penstemon smallii TaxID=265156 RepID=A0ABD3TEC9_9LAMI
MSAENQLNLVFIPFPIQGHIVSAVEKAKLLSSRNQRLSITILIMKLPFKTQINDSYTRNLPDSRINFVHLPQKDSTYSEHHHHVKSPEIFLIQFIESQKGLVKEAVANIIQDTSKSSCKLAGFVIDLLCTTMIDVGNEFKVPTYVFFSSGAATLGLFFKMQSLRDEYNQDVSEYDYEDPRTEISVPTYVNKFPATALPSAFLDKETGFIDIAKRFRETKGILINTFFEFESHAIKSLSNDEKIPHVYPVGPIIHLSGDESVKYKEESKSIITWLNQQPDSSVVFLCFGSIGTFDGNQVKEIATALENSGYRFLWSLRKPPPEEQTYQSPAEYEDFDQVLPEGFLQRTAAIGKVIGWAPQMAVLSHRATGGFVSHCGWNSTLESVWCGVPTAVWPLAAEQQANAFQLVKELGMAVDVKMDYRKNCGVIVEAKRIENAIRDLMDLKNGIRVKVNEMKKKSRTAVLDGGSSHDLLGRFIKSVVKNISY